MADSSAGRGTGARAAASVSTRWYWIRHAPVRAHEGRIYGQSDLGCDCGDTAVFRALARALPRDAVWVTNHLRRTHETAAARAFSGKVGTGSPSKTRQTKDRAFSDFEIGKCSMAAAGLPGPDAFPGPDAIELAEFAEQHLGEWQGLDRAAFFAGRPASARSLWFAPAHERAPGGESFSDVVARVRPAVVDVTARCRGCDIIAVAHGGTIRAALAVALDLDPKRPSPS